MKGVQKWYQKGDTLLKRGIKRVKKRYKKVQTWKKG